MSDIIVLSSGSDEETQKTPPSRKRKSINGIPRHFEGDKKTRFSFGVTNESIIENVEKFKTSIGNEKCGEERVEGPVLVNETSYSAYEDPFAFDNFHYQPDDYYHPEEIDPTTLNRSSISRIAIKTPKSTRRRSVSVSCFVKDSIMPSKPEVRTNEPPLNKVCSTFIDEEKRFDANMLSSDSEDEPSESIKKDTSDDGLNLRALLSPEKRTSGSSKRTKGKDKTEQVQNEFYGVYCLLSRSERPCYKNRCYIGYTVDPNRRIMQHNGGREKGGAKKTDSRGPWDMVCVVHGFPNHVAALRFEWAWQNPNVSKVLREKNLKKERKETPFAYQLRIACNLMNSQPFIKFALSFRWLITKEELPFPTSCLPPLHVRLKYGKVEREMSIVPSRKEDYVELGECRICGKDIEKLWYFTRCISSSCSAHFHATCLSEATLRQNKNDENLKNQLFPVKGNCPICSCSYLWGDVVREQRRILKVSNKASDEFKELAVAQGFAKL